MVEMTLKFIIERSRIMFQTINYEDILNKKLHGNYILIDVRSPKEHSSETIPRSINIPIFDEEERKLIGTIYDNESTEKAKQIGIEAASKKLPTIYKKVAKLSKEYNYLIFYCARGGYRSSSLVSLFKTLGVNAIKLDGGYKGYRKYIHEHLPKVIEKIKFVVLYGNTGTGKTEILKELQKLGNDILDLEGCANHRGSLLGSVGLGEQNSQKIFESLVYESLINRKSDTIFVEGESKRIGKIIMPEYLYDAIDNGINIKIEADIETRVNNLLKDYVHENDDELILSLNLLRHNLGNKAIDNYTEMIRKHEYRKVIEELIVKYYDPHYEFKLRDYEVTFLNRNSQETAKAIQEKSVTK